MKFFYRKDKSRQLNISKFDDHAAQNNYPYQLLHIYLYLYMSAIINLIITYKSITFSKNLDFQNKNDSLKLFLI